MTNISSNHFRVIEISYDNFSGIHNDNSVTIYNRVKPMCYGQHRTISESRSDGILYNGIGAEIFFIGY